MPVSLTKGERVSLTKLVPGLKKIRIDFSWKQRATVGNDFDCDASLFVVDQNRKVLGDKWFIFYNQPTAPDGSIVYSGDERTGGKETITAYLGMLPDTAHRLVIASTLHEAAARGQNFGQIQDACVRITDIETGQDVARYDLGEEFSTETALNLVEVYRNAEGWSLQAVGQGYANGLRGIAADLGVNVE